VSILVLLVSVLAIKIAIPHIIERTAGG